MPPPKLTLELEFPVALDRAARIPLQHQLREQLRQAMLEGRLAAGTRLPSTRALARTLGLSRTVTSAVYLDLIAEGYLKGQAGSGTFVVHDLPPLPPPRHPVPQVPPRWLGQAPPPATDEPDSPDMIAFRLGVPSTSSLPPRIWRETWKAVTSHLPPDNYGAPNGDLVLRVAIARYLGRSRGLACMPEDVVITAGATHALDLIARATLTRGDSVGFEDPGYPSARTVLLARGASLVPIPLDEDGLHVEQLPRGSAAPLLVYTTPSHQFPLATRLSVSRRLALLAWARANDSLVVEDDYDSEFRFDTSPLPALAGFEGAQCVAYLGTFSKVLTPALRVGYLVASPLLRERIGHLIYQTDEYVSWPLQRMLADFIANGHLERHIRRMRQHYAQKRQALAQALASIAPLAQLRGLEAGLHAYLALHPDLDATLVAHLARERGVLVTPLDARYYIRTPDRAGVLLGYGSLEIPEIIRGATVLKEIIAQLAGHSSR